MTQKNWNPTLRYDLAVTLHVCNVKKNQQQKVCIIFHKINSFTKGRKIRQIGALNKRLCPSFPGYGGSTGREADKQRWSNQVLSVRGRTERRAGVPGVPQGASPATHLPV